MQTSSAQVFNVLNRLMRTNGACPYGGVVVSEGCLYGTASGGGTYNSGVVFKLGADGAGYTVLHSFSSSDAWNPAGTVIYSDGVLYGTTSQGGGGSYSYGGAVYRLNASGANYRVLLYASQIGSSPLCGELVLSGSSLFGVTSGASSSDGGVVFAVQTDGSDARVLKRFGGKEFSGPQSGLLLQGALLYGTTAQGGSSNVGTVFALHTNGASYKVLKDFAGGGDGAWPYAPLVIAGASLYGSTTGGGENGHGTLFKLNPDGTGFRVLKHFHGVDGKYPLGGLLIMGGRLYGTAMYGGFGWDGAHTGAGTIFQLSTEGEAFSVLKHFTGDDGANPRGALVGVGNTIYGAAHGGGFNQAGVVFSLEVPVSPYVRVQPIAQAAAPGLAAVFTVEALGSLPLAYQWYFNGSNVLSGQTAERLQIGSVQSTHAGFYTVVVTNSFGAVTSAPAALTLKTPVRFVTEPTEAAFRAAAEGGGVVRFACDGVITLTSTFTNVTDLWLDGAGRSITFSGGAANRVILVRTNTTFVARDLTFAHGWARNGAGLLNDGGTVRLEKVTFLTNTASGAAGIPYGAELAEGGGLFNQDGVVTLTNCLFRGNVTEWTNNCCLEFLETRGGALATRRGEVIIQGCSFAANGACGPPGPAGRPGVHDACGGAIYCEGTVKAWSSKFSGNFAIGATAWNSAEGGHARGGAIYSAGDLELCSCLLVGNSAEGGRGAPGMDGLPMAQEGGAGGRGWPGGTAFGGAVFNSAFASIVNTTIVSNSAAGGQGGNGGHGGNTSPPPGKPSVGGDGGGGGDGGSGYSGVYAQSGECAFTNCTIAYNEGIPGPGGAGGEGGFGTRNGLPGTAGSAGGAGGGLNGTVAWLLNTILATNPPVNNTAATLVDFGHNLSSDFSWDFTNATSMGGVDLLLKPFADYGGPTWVIGLLPGSPAIDAAALFPAFMADQRGYPRPAGPAPDIGAFEANSVLPGLGHPFIHSGAVSIVGQGNPGQSCRLLKSVDHVLWLPVATNMFSIAGRVLFTEGLDTGARTVYFRLVTP